MSIKKCVITKGIYENEELRLLVSFDEKDNAVDLINIDNTRVGLTCEATVEKVLKDIDSCILKLSIGEKGFIENRKLNPEEYIYRQSENKKVCQGDKFFVSISQDPKGTKPCSCLFKSKEQTNLKNECGYIDTIDFYIESFVPEDCEIVSDIPEVISNYPKIREYNDDYSLWKLYDFTKIIDKAISKISYLKSGGNIVIEQTEAMTVVDVNSASNSGKTSSMDTNLEALEAIVREMRLRSISGIIIVDLLKVSKEQEQILINRFKELTKEDISKIGVHGFTKLGLLEITRSRIYAPISTCVK
ncbi:MAG: ribonuclease E/G [Pseudobutyrivibrio sp.]|nr:ribonuclease E/G [Pseudobutyrivibrio sp.]